MIRTIAMEKKHGGNGGGGDDYEGLDPLIAGLLRRMPQAGQPWPIPERARWLQTLAMNLSFIHEDDPGAATITVKVTGGESGGHGSVTESPA